VCSKGGRDNTWSSRTGTISGSKRQTRRARVLSDHVSVTTAPVFRSYRLIPDLILLSTYLSLLKKINLPLLFSPPPTPTPKHTEKKVTYSIYALSGCLSVSPPALRNSEAFPHSAATIPGAATPLPERNEPERRVEPHPPTIKTHQYRFFFLDITTTAGSRNEPSAGGHQPPVSTGQF
jgi:hypothetical protein